MYTVTIGAYHGRQYSFRNGWGLIASAASIPYLSGNSARCLITPRAVSPLLKVLEDLWGGSPIAGCERTSHFNISIS